MLGGERQSDVILDPEMLYLKSAKEVGGGDEWEKFKENVRPLKRGRNVKILNEALKSYTDCQLKKSLLQTRRKLLEAIEEYKGDDPLKPWIECIKWVQEAFPAGGDSSGLILIYEQCVRAFWHDDRFKDDLRFIKVWLEYAENCDDAEVIYKFLESNEIGQTHSVYYIAYALHMEAKHKIKTADAIFNRGLSMNARPREKLEAAYRKFLAQSMRRSTSFTEEDATDNNLPMRSFGTLISRGGARRVGSERAEASKKSMKNEGGQRVALSIYKDTNANVQNDDHPGSSKTETKAWDSLGSLKDRNKENNAIPSKWTSHKIPQKIGLRRGATATPSIEVFVDEECSTELPRNGEAQDSSKLQAREGGEEKVFKRESDLLRQNPLRNFPVSSLPR